MVYMTTINHYQHLQRDGPHSTSGFDGEHIDTFRLVWN